jgi:hypothetical protein
MAGLVPAIHDLRFKAWVWMAATGAAMKNEDERHASFRFPRNDGDMGEMWFGLLLFK